MSESKTRASARPIPQLTREYLETVRALAEILCKGGFGGSVENMSARILAGSQAGLNEMAAATWVTIIGGKPCIWGDAVPGLILASGLCVSHEESVEGSGDDRAAICTVQRSGQQAKTFRFSVADAKRAKLWNKQGPWQTAPDEMLTFRARNRAMRTVFPDVLCGLRTAEEARDHEPSAEISQEEETPTQPNFIAEVGAKVKQEFEHKPETPSSGSSKVSTSQIDSIVQLRDQYYLIAPGAPKEKAERSKWWRSFLWAGFKVESAKDLTPKQAEELIAELTRMVEEKSPF